MSTDTPSTHPAALDPQALLRSCAVERTRASGPGGQRRNKVETAVRILHRPTGVNVVAGERRSQEQNRRAALFRLRVKLAISVRHAVDAARVPSDRWRARCRKGIISVNSEHEDFPAILAEALDVVAAHDSDVKAAAGSLGCSATQLVHLLKVRPEALANLNEQRIRSGLRALR